MNPLLRATSSGILTLGSLALLPFTSLGPGASGRATPRVLDAGDEAAALGEALEVPLAFASPMDALDDAERERLAAATGTPADAFRETRLSEALAEDDRVLHVARQALPGEGEARAVLFALDEQHGFAGAAVLGTDDRPLEEWRHFLKDFTFYEVPRLEGAVPRSHLEQRRAAARASDDPGDRLDLALLDLLEAMHDQASVFNLPPEQKELSPTEEAEGMARAYERVAALADPLAPLLGEQAVAFTDLALDSAEAARRMGQERAADDGAAVRATRRRLVGNCRACHGLPLDGREEPLRATLGAVRRAHGIGDGFYKIKHDVRVRHPDQERAQRVADGLRAAALALDAARNR